MQTQRSILVTFCVLATLATFAFVLWEGNKTDREIEYAAVQTSQRPGAFTASGTSVLCVDELPQVTIRWQESARSKNYIIQRMYPWGGAWEVVGATTGLVFTDATYEANYPIGNFKYRIQAENSIGSQ